MNKLLGAFSRLSFKGESSSKISHTESHRNEAPSESPARSVLNKRTNVIVVDGNEIIGLLEIDGKEYELVLEGNEKKFSTKGPNHQVLAKTNGGKQKNIGAAWEKNGKDCGFYYWLVLTVNGNKQGYNAFYEKDENRVIVYNLVKSPF